MIKEYEVYKFSSNLLNNILSSFEQCHENMINCYQSEIESIKQNKDLSEEEKQIKIDSYICSISKIHDLLKENSSIINSIKNNVNALKNNIELLVEDDCDNYGLSLDEVTKNLHQIIKEECAKIFSIAKESEQLLNNESTIYEEELRDEFSNNNLNDNQELDIIKYKKYCTILNNSFWEARERTSLEEIKYPSALYEKTVKEFQNQILIENYNISLESIEKFLDDYNKKYAEDIYDKKGND